MAIRIAPLDQPQSAAPTTGGLRIQPLSAFLAGFTPDGVSTQPGAPTSALAAPASPDVAPEPYQPTPATGPSSQHEASMFRTMFPDSYYARLHRSSPHRYLWEDVGEGTRRMIGPNLATMMVDGVPIGGGLTGQGTPGSGSISPVSPHEGMTRGEVAAQFGHLAGRSPFSAAFGIPNPFSDMPTTPADVISAVYGAIPGPLMASLIGPIAQLGQQFAINEATPRTFQGFENAYQGSFEGGNLSMGPGMNMTAGLGGDGSGFSGGAGDAFHSGGPVGKGAPKGPERKAKLLEGEFVVKKEAAQKNRPLLDAINRGESPQKLKRLLDYLMTDMPKEPKS